MKKVFVLFLAVSLLCLVGCDTHQNKKTNLPSNDNQQQGQVEGNENIKLSKEVTDAYIEAVNHYESEYPAQGLMYDLIFFNNDETPDLVVNMPWYWISVFAYKDGKLHQPIEERGYGAFGINGYEYTEKAGILHYHDADYAGAVSNHITEKYNDDLQLSYYLRATMQGADLEEDDEFSGEVMRYLEEDGGFYYNNEKITEEEYNRKMLEITPSTSIEKELTEASMTKEEVLSQLTGKTVSEMERENKEALAIAIPKYEEATKFYGPGGLTYEEEEATVNGILVNKITNIDEARDFFTTSKFNQYVGREVDESDNMNGIIESDGDFYRIAADRGGNIYYLKTDLFPGRIEEGRMSFQAVSYYVSEYGIESLSKEEWDLAYSNPEKFIQDTYGFNIEKENHVFSVIKEDGAWKVDEFVLPF